MNLLQDENNICIEETLYILTHNLVISSKRSIETETETVSFLYFPSNLLLLILPNTFLISSGTIYTFCRISNVISHGLSRTDLIENMYGKINDV